LLLLEESLKKQKKWSLIANECFPHKNQHSIKNRVVSLLTTYSCKNRKEVYKVLKRDYFPYVKTAIEKITKDQSKKISHKKQEKIETISKQANVEIKIENTSGNQAEMEINTPNFAINVTNYEISLFNRIFQNEMAIYQMNYNNLMIVNNWDAFFQSFLNAFPIV